MALSLEHLMIIISFSWCVYTVVQSHRDIRRVMTVKESKEAATALNSFVEEVVKHRRVSLPINEPLE